MKLIIQCAGSKNRNAGFLQLRDGNPVKFVARPEEAPREQVGLVFARPDDLSDRDGRTWRQLLSEYAVRDGGNPFGLCPAYRLYRPSVYSELVRRFGPENVFILSAGWGLIRAGFPTPQYDITFSTSAESFKRRRKREAYEDFCQLVADSGDELFFFGGNDYLPLFYRLTAHSPAKKTVFHSSKRVPRESGYEYRHYETRQQTNWHYACATAFLRGAIPRS